MSSIVTTGLCHTVMSQFQWQTEITYDLEDQSRYKDILSAGSEHEKCAIVVKYHGTQPIECLNISGVWRNTCHHIHLRTPTARKLITFKTVSIIGQGCTYWVMLSKNCQRIPSSRTWWIWTFQVWLHLLLDFLISWKPRCVHSLVICLEKDKMSLCAFSRILEGYNPTVFETRDISRLTPYCQWDLDITEVEGGVVAVCMVHPCCFHPKRMENCTYALITVVLIVKRSGIVIPPPLILI